jgi:site-specific recombinase XerD
VRGKGSRSERLPVPADVGEALADYLRRARPVRAEGRSVFVRVEAPHRALTPAGVSQVVIAAGNRAGLGRVNAHRLRHTTATELLRSGAPLVEIGQLLRHRSQQTTAIYAKVDRERLRELARPWPCVGGVSRRLTISWATTCGSAERSATNSCAPRSCWRSSSRSWRHAASA